MITKAVRNVLSNLKLSPAMFDLLLGWLADVLPEWMASNTNKTQVYHIGLFGPSRIGKTTLIAAMVEEFKYISTQLYKVDKTHLKLASGDQSSTERISERINKLKSGINKGSFTTGTLTGTSSHEVFNLRFEEGKENSFKQNFILHDFPGLWVNDPDKLNELDMKNWDVFVLPTDAASIMESCQEKHKSVLRGNLAIDQVENVIRDWIRQREDFQSLCILAPVKCETYFTKPEISPILADRSQELYNKTVNEYYKGVVDIINNESRNVAFLYMPVNTIGCCYLKRPTWNPDGELEGLYAISPEPNKDTWSPYGPANIMLQIGKFMSNEIRKAPKSLRNKRIESFLDAVDKLQSTFHNMQEPYTRQVVLK